MEIVAASVNVGHAVSGSGKSGRAIEAVDEATGERVVLFVYKDAAREIVASGLADWFNAQERADIIREFLRQTAAGTGGPRRSPRTV